MENLDKYQIPLNRTLAELLVKKPEADYKSITERTCIVYVQNTKLAAALLELDIPLRTDPPYTHRIERGQRIVNWHFEQRSKCGRYQTIKLVKAWKRDIEFYLDPKNAEHPFKHIMCYAKNLEFLTNWILNKDEPFRVFALPDEIRVYAKLGSNKYNLLLQEGYKPI